jgi:hypothetical protein
LGRPQGCVNGRCKRRSASLRNAPADEVVCGVRAAAGVDSTWVRTLVCASLEESLRTRCSRWRRRSQRGRARCAPLGRPSRLRRPAPRAPLGRARPGRAASRARCGRGRQRAGSGQRCRARTRRARAQASCRSCCSQGCVPDQREGDQRSGGGDASRGRGHCRSDRRVTVHTAQPSRQGSLARQRTSKARDTTYSEKKPSACVRRSSRSWRTASAASGTCACLIVTTATGKGRSRISNALLLAWLDISLDSWDMEAVKDGRLQMAVGEKDREGAGRASRTPGLLRNDETQGLGAAAERARWAEPPDEGRREATRVAVLNRGGREWRAGRGGLVDGGREGVEGRVGKALFLCWTLLPRDGRLLHPLPAPSHRPTLLRAPLL